jgi:hypothetical protein
MRLARCPVLALLALGLAACAPRFTRESPLYNIEPLGGPVRLAVSCGPEVSPLLRTSLEQALVGDPDTASVNTSGVPREGERVVRIGTTARSAGLGVNFLISFPGFLAFAPLWYRFQWVYRVRTWVELERTGEPPLVFSQDEKFVVSDTTPGQGLGSELGFVGYGLPGIGAGIITATSPAFQTRFDESLGKEAGADWAHDALALIHRALRADEAAP